MTRTTKSASLSELDSQLITSSKCLEYSTFEVNLQDGTRIVRLHNTNIITEKNGTITFNSGGWKTQLTKNRINAYSDFSIRQEKGIWYIKTPQSEFIFYDNITFDRDGNLLSELKEINLKEVNKLKRKISRFVKLIDNFDEIPFPDSGDCWFCMMQTEDGESLGDATGDNSHLLSHINEGYMHGSLLVNAMRHVGYRNEQIGFIFRAGIKNTVKRAVYRYLKEKLVKQEDFFNTS